MKKTLLQKKTNSSRKAYQLHSRHLNLSHNLNSNVKNSRSLTIKTEAIIQKNAVYVNCLIEEN